MPRINKAFVERVTKHKIYYDSDLKGFALRVRKTKKSFIVRAKQRGTGKVVFVTIGGYPTFTAEEARSHARVILNKLACGINPNDERKEEILRLEENEKQKEEDKAIKKLTLQKVFFDYLAARNLQRTTEYGYKCALKSCMRDWLKKPLIEINKDMIMKRFMKISAKGKKGAANHGFRLLRALFTFASIRYEDSKGEPIIKTNPVKAISQARMWNKEKRRQSVIKAHELKPWYQAVVALEHETARDYLLLLLFTGLRKSEAAKLRWEDVDFKGRTILIRETKNDEPHMLPLTNYLYKLLLNRWQNRVNEYVFPAGSREGYIINVRKQMLIVMESSGVDFMLHDLRRTFLTIADSLDISAYAIKKLANHKMSSDVTAGYIVSDVERLRGPMDRISALILGRVSLNRNQLPKIEYQPDIVNQNSVST